MSMLWNARGARDRHRNPIFNLYLEPAVLLKRKRLLPGLRKLLEIYVTFDKPFPVSKRFLTGLVCQWGSPRGQPFTGCLPNQPILA